MPEATQAWCVGFRAPLGRGGGASPAKLRRQAGRAPMELVAWHKRKTRNQVAWGTPQPRVGQEGRWGGGLQCPGGWWGQSRGRGWGALSRQKRPHSLQRKHLRLFEPLEYRVQALMGTSPAGSKGGVPSAPQFTTPSGHLGREGYRVEGGLGARTPQRHRG